MAQDTKNRSKSASVKKSTAERTGNASAASAAGRKTAKKSVSRGSAAKKTAGRTAARSSSGTASGSAGSAGSSRTRGNQRTVRSGAAVNSGKEGARRIREEKERGIRRDIALVALLIFMIFLLFSLFGAGGMVGRALADILFGLFGIGAYPIPVFVLLTCLLVITKKGGKNRNWRLFGVWVMIFVIRVAGHLWLHAVNRITLSLVFRPSETFSFCSKEHLGGGIAGGFAAHFLYSAFGMPVSILLLAGFMIISLLLILQRSPLDSLLDWIEGREVYEEDLQSASYQRILYEQRRLEELENHKGRTQERGRDQGERRIAEEEGILSPQGHTFKKKRPMTAREARRKSLRDGWNPVDFDLRADRAKDAVRRRADQTINAQKETRDVHEITVLPQKTEPRTLPSSERRRTALRVPAGSGAGSLREDSLENAAGGIRYGNRVRRPAGLEEEGWAEMSAPARRRQTDLDDGRIEDDGRIDGSINVRRGQMASEGRRRASQVNVSIDDGLRGRREGRGEFFDLSGSDSKTARRIELPGRGETPGRLKDPDHFKGSDRFEDPDYFEGSDRFEDPDHSKESDRFEDLDHSKGSDRLEGSDYSKGSDRFEGSDHSKGSNHSKGSDRFEAPDSFKESDHFNDHFNEKDMYAPETGKKSGASVRRAGNFVQDTLKGRAGQNPDWQELSRIPDGTQEIQQEISKRRGMGSGGAGSGSAARGTQISAPSGRRQDGDTSAIAVHRDSGSREPAPFTSTAAPKKGNTYAAPTFSLLDRGQRGKNEETERELRETARCLEETLRTFGVQVRITDISQGPSVTRYELMPEQGVKVSRIVSLSDDIKLRLAATDIRIEAPIPGKSAIGIEVPNKTETTVHLRELVESREFRRSEGRLPFAVGKDIGGKNVIADIARMPHLLIAGATGSGKSVCINTIILSILYRTPPEKVRLLMIDPKVVELSVYKKIPHLIIPVVTDARKASAALNWAVAEMEKRYRLFAAAGVRDLNGFNALAASWKAQTAVSPEQEPVSRVQEPLPRLVIIVDELADLMMVSKNEVEGAICRLAQLARAAGIHLIIATQRPSVDVITGLIKANMPSRIAFAVSSQVDSRTILDMAGAEKLIGKGDMLFYPQNYQKPARIQGAFVSDEEVTRVVEYIQEHNSRNAQTRKEETRLIDRQIEEIAENGLPGPDPGDAREGSSRDEYFAEAGRFVIEKNKASIGLLQRVFKIGFNRAARIMDQLAEAGAVSEESSTRARQVLMTLPEFESYLQGEE